MPKLILTAVLAFGAGAGATYGTVQITAICQAPVPQQDVQTQKFLAAPDLPMTGWKRY